ncbi:hypothetical protein O7606_06745 [Micromonospora sp. WMMD882]|uniref:hypothetical protein n=1 Tax=Micromonospora sp. WMMD882 TaxID=3015151 RepID=UPI00248C6954|nr:hypothetical protein [Micromonospora sp. WMMD882]WBB81074.1 hypothetical protein O7606_06745 [Micromonospora sp. WMMD882]
MNPLVKVAVGVAAAVLGSTMIASPATAATLTVDGSCDAWFGVGQWRDFYCAASASGGTGDYHYAWWAAPFTILEVDEGPSVNGYCSAYADTRAVVTVTSGTETASASFPFTCS